MSVRGKPRTISETEQIGLGVSRYANQSAFSAGNNLNEATISGIYISYKKINRRISRRACYTYEKIQA